MKGTQVISSVSQSKYSVTLGLITIAFKGGEKSSAQEAKLQLPQGSGPRPLLAFPSMLPRFFLHKSWLQERPWILTSNLLLSHVPTTTMFCLTIGPWQWSQRARVKLLWAKINPFSFASSQWQKWMDTFWRILITKWGLRVDRILASLGFWLSFLRQSLAI